MLKKSTNSALRNSLQAFLAQPYLFAAVPNSRAHPALPPSQATPQGLTQASPRTNPFAQHMASKPPTPQPNGGLSHVNSTIGSGQPNNWLRPSVQQILMQQALLQQQGQMLPRQAQQQQSPLIRPGTALLMACYSRDLLGRMKRVRSSCKCTSRRPFRGRGSYLAFQWHFTYYLWHFC